jgi:hypothetical protein
LLTDLRRPKKRNIQQDIDEYICCANYDKIDHSPKLFPSNCLCSVDIHIQKVNFAYILHILLIYIDMYAHVQYYTYECNYKYTFATCIQSEHICTHNFYMFPHVWSMYKTQVYATKNDMYDISTYAPLHKFALSCIYTDKNAPIYIKVNLCTQCTSLSIDNSHITKLCISTYISIYINQSLMYIFTLCKHQHTHVLHI